MFNNYLEIRVDAYNISYACRRPEPKGAEDIGTWYTILEIMATVGVVTNAALIVFTSGNAAQGMSIEWKMWFFIAMEHVVLLIKFFLALLVNDVPHEVRLQRERASYLVDKIIYLIADDDDIDHLHGNRVDVDLNIASTEHV